MPHLIPYIQLHEFEALVFAAIDGVRENFREENIDFDLLSSIQDAYSSPEDINRDNPPSKRLKSCIKGYNKIIDSKIIIEAVGIDVLLEKCPRFKNWTNTLIQQAKTP